MGRGFSRRNLFSFRQFYLCYPIVQSVIAQFGLSLPSAPSVTTTALDWQDDAYSTRLFQSLPWTHFIELKRQMGSMPYERIGVKLDKERAGSC